jgi:hypothetical protein
MRRGLVPSALCLALVCARAAAAQEVWQDWVAADADKILECAAILDLLEPAPEGADGAQEAWPEGVAIDFPAAAETMRARVALAQGAAFTERRYAAHLAYWQQAGPQDPKVAGLEAFLEECRLYGTTHGLPM